MLIDYIFFIWNVAFQWIGKDVETFKVSFRIAKTDVACSTVAVDCCVVVFSHCGRFPMEKDAQGVWDGLVGVAEGIHIFWEHEGYWWWFAEELWWKGGKK